MKIFIKANTKQTTEHSKIYHNVEISALSMHLQEVLKEKKNTILCHVQGNTLKKRTIAWQPK
jgi:hypothetical protein